MAKCCTFPPYPVAFSQHDGMGFALLGPSAADAPDGNTKIATLLWH
jgi:hypothetical protein